MNREQSPYQNEIYDHSASSFLDDGIDIKRYISLFISNWYWFIIALFFSLSIAYAVNRWSEKLYTVSSSLLIKDDQFGESGSGISNIFPGSDLYKSKQNLNNEIGILKSFDLNSKLMHKLPEFQVEYIGVGKRGLVETKLYNRSPIKVIFDSITVQKLNETIEIEIIDQDSFKLSIDRENRVERNLAFGDRFNEFGYDFILVPRSSDRFRIDDDESNRYFIYFISPDVQANRYRNRLSISPIADDASLVKLTISGPVPAQLSDYLNSLMDDYLQYGLDIKTKTATKTLEFIETQLKTISDSLEQAEGDLELFRFENNLINISQEGALIQNKLEQYDSEKTTLLLKQNYYKYLKEYILSKQESGDIVAPSVMGVTDPILLKLVNDLSEYQTRKKELGMNISSNTGPIRVIENNILTTRTALVENIENGLKTIENLLFENSTNLRSVEKQLKVLPTKEREMIVIQRQFDVNNTVYTFLLEKRAEAGIAKASSVPDNRIIDQAGTHSLGNVKPKKRQNLMMALILGFIIPGIIIVVIDLLNNKIIDKKDIGKGTSAPIIGFISHNNQKTELPVHIKPGSTLAESFRSVRTNLKYFLLDIENPVISVSSTISDEGKTFISANLAAIIASLGKKVLLVGLDLRKPRVHKILGNVIEPGVSSFLANQNNFDEVIHETQIENLWYAPSGRIPPNPAELIDSERMQKFINLAKSKFDYIIIDTPPVAIVTDALLISHFTDLYIFVVRQRYSSKNTLGLIEELRTNENIKNIGIVMNDISLSGYYGYGLRYGYTAGYGGYTYGYNYYGEYSYGVYGRTYKQDGYYTDENE